MTKRTMAVKAECHSDDRICECPFNAIPWLKKATYEEIEALHLCGWGGDYPADEVAIYMAGKNEDVAFMFKYIEKKNKAGEDIGFECHVDKDEALAWLNKSRNKLYTRLINETTPGHTFSAGPGELFILPKEEDRTDDWKYEVANGDTHLGYDEWLQHQKEMKSDENI